MLLVVLLKDKKPEVLDVLPTDAAASIVVNALKNRKFPYIAFTGNSDNLVKFGQAIKSKKFNLDETIEREIVSLADNFNCHLKTFDYTEATAKEILSNLQFEGYQEEQAYLVLSFVLDKQTEIQVKNYKFGFKDNKFYHNAVVSAGLPNSVSPKVDSIFPQRSPAKTMYPKSLNSTEMNKKIWQFVIKNFTRKIKESYPDSFEKQWIMAMILYQRVCLAKKVRPWKVDTRNPQSTVSVRDRLVMEDNQVDVFMDKLLVNLELEKLILKVEDLRFNEVVKNKDKYELIFSRKVTLPANVSGDEVMYHLRSHFGWLRSKGYASIELSSITDVDFICVDNVCRFKITYTLPANFAAALVESDQDILAKTRKLMQVWMETGKLKFRKKDLM